MEKPGRKGLLSQQRELLEEVRGGVRSEVRCFNTEWSGLVRVRVIDCNT